MAISNLDTAAGLVSVEALGAIDFVIIVQKMAFVTTTTAVV